ncbi:unnamed protein product [Calypogeia fissa]
MLDYIEVPENFQALVGGGRYTKIGGCYPTKAMLFKQMAVVLHAAGFPEEIKGPNLQKYKEAQAFKCGSGHGLTEDDLRDHIGEEDGEFGMDQDVTRYAPDEDDSSNKDDEGLIRFSEEFQEETQQSDTPENPSSPTHIVGIGGNLAN